MMMRVGFMLDSAADDYTGNALKTSGQFDGGQLHVVGVARSSGPLACRRAVASRPADTASAMAIIGQLERALPLLDNSSGRQNAALHVRRDARRYSLIASFCPRA